MLRDFFILKPLTICDLTFFEQESITSTENYTFGDPQNHLPTEQEKTV